LIIRCWHKDDCCELYGIIAKNVEGKEELREGGYLVFDLEDFRLYLNGMDVKD
jgi:hypothetical protein